MRWDIADGLPEYIRRADIFVNGERQRSVTAFDLHEGWVRRLCLDANGQPFIDPARPDEAAQEVVRGTVHLEVR